MTFTVSKKWKKKIYKLGKVDDRIPVLQVTRSRSKKQKTPIYESRKVVLNQAQD